MRQMRLDRHGFAALAVAMALLTGCATTASPPKEANASPAPQENSTILTSAEKNVTQSKETAATDGKRQERIFISGYGAIHVVDPVAWKIVKSLQVPGSVRDMPFTADGRRLYASVGGRHVIQEFDTVKLEPLESYNLSEGGVTRTIYGVTVGHNPRQLYIHYTQHAVKRDHFEVLPNEIGIYDLDQKKLIKTMPAPRGVHQLFTVENGQLAAFGQDLSYIDVNEMKVVETKGLHNPGPSDQHKPIDFLWFWPRTPGVEGSLATIPAGAIGPGPTDVTGAVMSFNPKDGKMEITELGPAVGYFSSVLSPDGRWLYQTFNATTKVDMKTKKEVARIDNPNGTAYGINMSPDGKYIYLSGAGADLTLLDAENLKVLKSMDLPSDTMDLRVVLVPET